MVVELMVVYRMRAFRTVAITLAMAMGPKSRLIGSGLVTPVLMNLELNWMVYSRVQDMIRTCRPTSLTPMA